MKRLCVFCGANTGTGPRYLEAARELGTTLARAGVGVVYGGAGIGLMGALADAARTAGGEVIGVIPQNLMAREVAHRHLEDLRVVGSMHERKALMAELADGFIALPGGVGTLEELFEVWTWSHLGLHRKPCALLDVDGFYRGLSGFLDHVDQQHVADTFAQETLTIDMIEKARESSIETINVE
ncbi:MAG: TIGR00730 family Rossman fold protein [Gammaproteobacteria bacterium]|nr:TIGR00730 family Rossman fold protein [Gammaproteobacteria bacterium]